VKSRILVLSIISISFFSLLIFSSCRKINEGTTIGDDLIPVVDNITTFDTSLSVQAFNGVFTDLDDSTRMTAAAEHFLGRINNDPLFGKTDASLFLQLKPTFYPFYFNAASDSVTSKVIDSVVLILGYVETYGDTNAVQNFRVYEMDNTNKFNPDSFYLIRSNTFTYSNLLTSSAVSIIPNRLNDSSKPLKETPTVNQLRIKLDNAFGTRLLSYDSTINSAYFSDSTFDSKFNGFAIVPDNSNNGNAILGVNLLDSNTKLAIYYKWYKNNGSTPFDTTVRYFRFTGSAAQANQMNRDYAGNNPQIQSYLSNSPTTPDDLVFIQNTPGTFAKLKVPDLNGLSNRLVHRAELVVEEVYDQSDDIFGPPQYLFLDAYDSAKGKYRTIPYDFLIDLTGGINVNAFGMIATNKDVNGKTIKKWTINLTRYVQHIVTNHETNYELRLFSPNYVRDIYSGDPLGSVKQINVNPTIGKGRVRLAGGNHSSNQRMRLRIVYSKI
jgi:uncharacterized protein DUF4270